MQMRVMDGFPTSKDVMSKRCERCASYVQTCDLIIICEAQPLAQDDEG